MQLLAPEAADSINSLENDTGGLIYTDTWKDPITSLLAKRTKKLTILPGYSGHNYGLSVDLDIKTILNEKKIRYEDLLHIMKKRYWYCHRRDGREDLPGYRHFNFLGHYAQNYLLPCTLDPTTWDRAIEQCIWEKYKDSFSLEPKKIQELLTKAHYYWGPINGSLDTYTREAILAFQRTWDLIQNGFADQSLCRTLAFVTADLEII